MDGRRTRGLRLCVLCAVLVAACGGRSEVPSETTFPTGPGETAPARTYALQVRRYFTTVITDSEVDGILGEATRILRVADSPDDVACDAGLMRTGAVTPFSEGDGAIDGEQEFRDYIGLAGHIKVINEINWCGGYKPNVIGCASTPGSALVVVRYLLTQEGILWAHEYGHNKGAGHRNVERALMNETVGSTHRNLDEAERLLFLK